MGYCSCFRWTTSLPRQLKNDNDDNEREFKPRRPKTVSVLPSSSDEASKLKHSIPEDVSFGSKARIFNYRELATVTNNFRFESLVGEGGFGAVYRGKIETTGQIIAVKKLNQTGIQGDKEFLVEVLMLTLLRHQNLVNLIGYCAEGNQRLLVYEYMPLGSLAKHLHGLPSDAAPLEWNIRMRIAAGAAEGLNYLHNEANPNVIYRDLKSANILLDEGFHSRLSDFGLAKFGPEGDKSHVSTRVMGTQGYCAPEYAITGKLTKMSDIFSFGVVLLELLTGQQALDPTRGHGKHFLVDWAHPILKDSKNFLQVADPKLKGRFPEAVFCKVADVASMCVREAPQTRPCIGEIVLALNYLYTKKYKQKGQNCANDERIRESPHKHDHGKDDVKVYISGTENDLTNANKELERKLAVAEAKLWGETWREKKKLPESEYDSLAR